MGTTTSIPASQAKEKLTAWLEGNHRLPIQPSVFLKLMELGKNSNASPNDYAAVITASNSLTSKVLSAVNSS
jgi:HD-like signal output (HDOD) protein